MNLTHIVKDNHIRNYSKLNIEDIKFTTKRGPF